jgi:hypothetical protein
MPASEWNCAAVDVEILVVVNYFRLFRLPGMCNLADPDPRGAGYDGI